MDRKELDRPEYGSYEDVHEQLVQAMQEACMNDTSREYETPDIDMSFLYDDTVVPETKTKHIFTRFNKVAAIVIAALLGLNAVLLISDSSEVYSEKGLLHRIYVGARGIFTDEDPSQFVEMDETGAVFIVNDMKNIDEAKEFCEDLYIPQYIPEGYEFIELNISKDLEDNCKAEYLYRNNHLKFSIIYFNYDNSNGRHLSNLSEVVVEDEDRIINIYNDRKNDMMAADIYLDEKYISVYGDLSEEEIINIARNMKK